MKAIMKTWRNFSQECEGKSLEGGGPEAKSLGCGAGMSGFEPCLCYMPAM